MPPSGGIEVPTYLLNFCPQICPVKEKGGGRDGTETAGIANQKQAELKIRVIGKHQSLTLLMTLC